MRAAWGLKNNEQNIGVRLGAIEKAQEMQFQYSHKILSIETRGISELAAE